MISAQLGIVVTCQPFLVQRIMQIVFRIGSLDLELPFRPGFKPLCLHRFGDPFSRNDPAVLFFKGCLDTPGPVGSKTLFEDCFDMEKQLGIFLPATMSAPAVVGVRGNLQDGAHHPDGILPTVLLDPK